MRLGRGGVGALVACGVVGAGVLARLLLAKPKRKGDEAEMSPFDRGYMALKSELTEKERATFEAALDSMDPFLRLCPDLEKVRQFCNILAGAVLGEMDLAKADHELRFLVTTGMRPPLDEVARTASLRGCDGFIAVLRRHQQRRSALV